MQISDSPYARWQAILVAIVYTYVTHQETFVTLEWSYKGTYVEPEMYLHWGN